jgi:hypothetical protein
VKSRWKSDRHVIEGREKERRSVRRFPGFASRLPHKGRRKATLRT